MRSEVRNASIEINPEERYHGCGLEYQTQNPKLGEKSLASLRVYVLVLFQVSFPSGWIGTPAEKEPPDHDDGQAENEIRDSFEAAHRLVLKASRSKVYKLQADRRHEELLQKEENTLM
jgi:hypothetical protein